MCLRVFVFVRVRVRSWVQARACVRVCGLDVSVRCVCACDCACACGFVCACSGACACARACACACPAHVPFDVRVHMPVRVNSCAPLYAQPSFVCVGVCVCVCVFFFLFLCVLLPPVCLACRAGVSSSCAWLIVFLFTCLLIRPRVCFLFVFLAARERGASCRHLQVDASFAFRRMRWRTPLSLRACALFCGVSEFIC